MTYTWNGIPIEADHNGWRWMHYYRGASWILTVQISVRRPELVIALRGCNTYRWQQPEGITLGIACVVFGEPVQPLLDWCLENAGWAKEMIEEAIAALQETPV